MKFLFLNAIFLCSLFFSNVAFSGEYLLGVTPQRSAILTARYWNPILDWIEKRTGEKIVLRFEKTVNDSDNKIENGEYDFVYSNTIFSPKNKKQKYQIILTEITNKSSSKIIVNPNSNVKTIYDLEGKEIGFPSKIAFLGYVVPMNMLLKYGIKVNPVYGGNQEGIISQFSTGKLNVVAVNDEVLQQYTERNNLNYIVLWESLKFENIPIAVHPRVDEAVRNKIINAFLDMATDDNGKMILQKSANAIGQKKFNGFKRVYNKDYKAQLDVYENNLIKGL